MTSSDNFKATQFLTSTGMFSATITVFALLFIALSFQSNYQNIFAQQSSINQTSTMNNNNESFLSVNPGIPVIESKGMVQSQKVLEVQPLPKLETSFVENDTIKGGSTKATDMGTYSSVIKSDGAIYGEGKGIITTPNGEMTTWTGQGIGHVMADGTTRFTGTLLFSNPFPEKAGNLSFLNNMVGIFIYDIHADGKISSKVWELK